MYGWTNDLHKIGGYFAIRVITVGKLDVGSACRGSQYKTVTFGIFYMYLSSSFQFHDIVKKRTAAVDFRYP